MFYKDLFIKYFNLNHIAIELMDLCDQDKLFEFIIDKFNKEVAREELKEELIKRYNDDETEETLKEMGY